MNIIKLSFLSFIFTYLCLISASYSAPPNSEEELLYTTVKIKSTTNLGNTHLGTGFIYDFPASDGRSYAPYLVTNKHVINPDLKGSEVAIRGELTFNLSHNGHTPTATYNIPLGESEHPSRYFYNKFIQHTENVDLCAMPLSNIIHAIESDPRLPSVQPDSLPFSTPSISFQALQPSPTRVLYRSLSYGNIVDFQRESAIQDILMIGYPMGISDEANGLPIVRKGITASHLRTNYKGKPEVLIDAACFPGSSGSPVFLKNSDQFFRAKLLGILWGGPPYEVDGSIVCDLRDPICKPIETAIVQSFIPAHLGFVIKSTELANIQSQIR